MKEDIIGRKKEVAELERLYQSNKSEFIAVYGRRRVGKTFLIKQLFEKELVFSVTGLANQNTSKQLKNFHNTLKMYDKSPNAAPKDWIDAFDLLIQYLQKIDGRKAILIDELPWMDTPRSGFIAALEHFWNGWASMRKDIMLIVCGSVSSWIMDKLINSHGGLHNRITKRILLKPFNLAETEEMLQSIGMDLSRYEVAETYMIMGGIPFYLSMFNPAISLSQNIDALFFNEDRSLSNEFENLYASLFRNSDNYIKVVTTLSKVRNGMTREEIEKESGIETGGTLSKILSNLEACGFIRKYDNIGKDSRKKYYQLMDFFTLFYFHFISGNDIRNGFWSAIQGTSTFYAWAGISFEMMALLHVGQIKQKLGISGILTEEFAWRKENSGTARGAQIDLVIHRSDKTVNLCEMKFSEDTYTIDYEESLKLRNRLTAFKATFNKPCNSVQLTFVTTFGLTKGKHSGIAQNEVVLDDLFA